MTQTQGPDDRAQGPTPVRAPDIQAKARERTIAGMVIASLFSVLGTLIFAWALRAPDSPWLFAVGAVPWVAGILLFGFALWRYTRS